MVIAVIIIVALLLINPSVQGVLKNIITSPFTPRYPEEATFSLERTLTVSANGGEVIGYSFDIPEPMNISQNGYQIQTINSVQYEPEVEVSTKYGQKWVNWTGGDLEGNQERVMTATYVVNAKTHIWTIDASSSGTVDDIPSDLKQQYLHDEWKINMTDPAIVSLSNQIVGEETDVYTILRGIYDWTVANIRYPSVALGGEPQSAVETLQSGVGDCDDQSILFCSLARAAGVPAWLQLGALYVNIDDSWGGHGWIQTFIPLNGSEGEKVVIDTVNKDFLVWRPNRFVEFTDDGVASHLTDYYYTYTVTYDSSTYTGGRAPKYSESYTALFYDASDRKVSQGSVYNIEYAIRPADTCLAPSRR